MGTDPNTGLLIQGFELYYGIANTSESVDYHDGPLGMVSVQVPFETLPVSESVLYILSHTKAFQTQQTFVVRYNLPTSLWLLSCAPEGMSSSHTRQQLAYVCANAMKKSQKYCSVRKTSKLL